MTAHSILSQSRALTWPERVTLARANHALAPIYIESIRTEAKANSRRRYDADDTIATAAACLITALEDVALELRDAADLADHFDELDALFGDDDAPRGHHYGHDDGYGDWLYDQRRDREMLEQWERGL